MPVQTRRPRLRLPEKLASTTFRIAIAGALSCSGSSVQPAAVTDASVDGPADASTDALADAADGLTPQPTPDAAPTDGPSDAPEDMVAADGPADAPTDAPLTCPGDAQPTVYCLPAIADASCPEFVCDISQCEMDAGCEIGV